MTSFELSANKRTLMGRKVKQLRVKGLVPANIFGKKIKSQAIEVSEKALLPIMRQAGETGLINLAVQGSDKSHPVLVAGYAQDPVSGIMLHVDFHEVDLKQKVTAMVPVKAVGESEATKSGLVLVMLKNELEVEALPTDLPESIEVDVTGLVNVDDSIHAKDLKLDRSKVTLLAEDEELIVTIQEPAKEEVVEAPAPVEGETAPADSSAEAKAVVEGEAKSEEKKE